MIRCKSLKEAKKKYKEVTGHEFNPTKYGTATDIFHKKGSKTWWIGSYFEWINK